MSDTQHVTRNTQHASHKVMVIGLDGATWDVLQPWMEAGYLPNLASLVVAGTSGRLRSTIPPVTAPAWATFQTGMNPGKHGLFHFTRYQPGSYDTALVNATSIAPRTLCGLLGDAGKAKKNLKWEPKVTFKELAKMMVEADMKLAENEKIIKEQKEAK